jgi:hypothetical protein
MNNKLLEDFNLITDTFTNADEKWDFLRLRFLLEKISDELLSGHEDAQKALDIVHNFANLIRYAQRHSNF